MKPLFKLIAVIACFFLSTFIIIKATGIITVEDIETWLSLAQQQSVWVVGIIVVSLLFADLFIAVPTLTVTILAGYFLGMQFGVSFAMAGMLLAGFSGYIISWFWGKHLFNRLLPDEAKQRQAIDAFQQHGFILILLSRAVPILPEVTACLAGMTKMPFRKFALAWLISTTPYVALAAYSGSISSLSNPKPAIFTAIGITFVMWLAWGVFYRTKRVSILTTER